VRELLNVSAPLRRRCWIAGTAAVLAVPAVGLRAAPARRVVSVGGAITEIVYALGGERELVGVDTTSLYPAAARVLPSVGYARALSAEGVLSLAPSLLLATREAGPPAVMAQLRGAGVPVQTLDNARSFDGVVDAVRRVATWIGREREGRALAAQLDQQWSTTQRHVQARRNGQPAPRVLFVLSHSLAQVRIAGRDTAADAVVTLAGGANAFGEVSGYKPLSPEAAIAAAPTHILTTDQGLQAAGGIAGLLKAPGLAATPAGRARRVLTLDALLLLGFGPRLPQAVAQLADALYPGG
jgi:iron complex transport system substrate-binding protein